MSNPITITVSNKDAGNLYILVFQKPPNVSEMYDTLFPTAWKVLPLSNSSSANISYPMELQIMVKESAASYDARDRGTIKETEVGQLWQFFVDRDFPMLKKVPGKTVDGLMGCVNKAPQKIDVGLAKGGKTLVVKRKVSQDDQANFKLTDKLYFAYVNDIEEGELIKSDISASKTYELSLMNLKSVEIELSVEDHNTGKKKWIERNRKSAS
jgi:hypothetical protein